MHVRPPDVLLPLAVGAAFIGVVATTVTLLLAAALVGCVAPAPRRKHA